MNQKQLLFTLFLSLLYGCHTPSSQKLNPPSARQPQIARNLEGSQKTATQPNLPILFSTPLLETKAGYQLHLIHRGFVILPKTVAEELKKENLPRYQVLDLLPQVKVFKNKEGVGWLTKDFSMVGTTSDLIFSLLYSDILDGNLESLPPPSAGKILKKGKPSRIKSREPWLTLASIEVGTKISLYFSEPQNKFEAKVLISSSDFEEEIYFSYESSFGKTCAFLRIVGKVEGRQICIRTSTQEEEGQESKGE